MVWNPDREWMLTADTLQSAAGYCPLEGTCLKGRAEQVYLRGMLAAENGIIRQAYLGKYQTAAPRI